MNTNSVLSIWDFVLTPFYVFVILLVAQFIQKKYIRKNHVYKFFIYGLFAKIIGAISLCLIYVYYYSAGGDTLSYQSSAKTMVNLLFDSYQNFFKVLFNPISPENFYCFNDGTGYPDYWGDAQAFGAVRLITPLELLACKNYIVTSVLIAMVCYSGIWKLYLLFCERYPSLYKQFALTVLFIPSVIFWGSGVLKDSWTIAAACWYCYSFYRIFIKQEKIIFHTITILVSVFVLVLIKPYIFVALLPGSILWGVWSRIMSIKSVFLKATFLPFVVVTGIFAGVGIWSLVSSNLGEYSSVDSMINKAYVSYEDLKQDYYQGNSFDLGTYDPTLSGILTKFPVATLTGLFRPFLWEARNAASFMSGLENLFILLFTFYVLSRRPITTFKNLFSNPLVLFCLIFAVFFAFSVAISTSNFGALVRLRIPLLPFLLSGLVIINYAGSRKFSSAQPQMALQ